MLCGQEARRVTKRSGLRVAPLLFRRAMPEELKGGKKRILFRIFVEHRDDVASLTHKLELILDNSVVRQDAEATKNKYLIIEINEDQEEYLERLLEYSSVVVSGHRVEKA